MNMDQRFGSQFTNLAPALDAPTTAVRAERLSWLRGQWQAICRRTHRIPARPGPTLLAPSAAVSYQADTQGDLLELLRVSSRCYSFNGVGASALFCIVDVGDSGTCLEPMLAKRLQLKAVIDTRIDAVYIAQR